MDLFLTVIKPDYEIIKIANKIFAFLVSFIKINKEVKCLSCLYLNDSVILHYKCG